MITEKYTALVFGASGLTGRFLIEHLIGDPRYDTIKLFVREEINIPHGKITQVIYSPDRVEDFNNEIAGDHLFCCIGTTIKKAGSRDAFYKIDHTLVERIAKVASSNKVRSFVVISSIGANDRTSNFYLSTKGKMEESIKTFTFNNLSILRPSMLLGMRHEKRSMEEFGKTLAKAITPLLIGSFRKYRPIHASQVAQAMILLANKSKGIYIVESDEISNLLKT